MYDYTKLPDIQQPGEFIKAAKKDRKLWIPIIATAAEIIALLGLMGLLTLIQADFIIKDIDFVSFGVLASMRMAILFLSKDVSARARVNSLKRDTEYKELADKYQDEIADVKNSELDEYLKNVANPQRKIAAHKAVLQPKIEKLSADLEDLDLKSTIAEKNKDAGWFVFKFFKKWRYKIIQKKIADKNIALKKYNTLISDEYIKEHYKTLRVKYEVLTVDKFMTITQNESERVERVSINPEMEIKKGILKGLPMALLLSAYLALVGWENTVLGAFDILTLALDILLISWYFLQGWFLVGGKVVDAIRNALIYKTTFIQKFKVNTVPVVEAVQPAIKCNKDEPEMDWGEDGKS